MSTNLQHLVTKPTTVTVKQASKTHPEVKIDVFGLRTKDLIALYQHHARDLELIGRQTLASGIPKEGLAAKQIALIYPVLATELIVMGMRNPHEWAYDLIVDQPVMVQVDLITTIMSLTFPEGLKKSLERLLPMLDLMFKS